MNSDSLLHEALQCELPAGLAARVEGALFHARARQERRCHTVRVACSGLCVITLAGLFVSVSAYFEEPEPASSAAYEALALTAVFFILLWNAKGYGIPKKRAYILRTRSVAAK